MPTTNKSNMIVPEVWGNMVQAEFKGKMVMNDFVLTNTTLQGEAGDTIHFPKFKAISDATDLAEGTPMDTEVLSTEDATATIKEAGKAVEITDSALVSALGNPLGEATRQLGVVIARKVDKDLIDEAISAVPVGRKVSGLGIADAVIKAKTFWGDEFENIAVLLVHSTVYQTLVKDTNFQNNIMYNQDVLLKGEIGRLFGIPVVMTDRVPYSAGADGRKATCLMMERNALAYITKRLPMVEKDRDILARTTVVSTNVHYAVKAIKPEGLATLEIDVAGLF